jgi:hypothetical protein
MESHLQLPVSLAPAEDEIYIASDEQEVPQSRQSAKLFLQSSELGSPNPHTRRRVCPPPFGSGGGRHSLAVEGVHGGPNSDEGTDTKQVHCEMPFDYIFCHL